eukprot:TRINITY_DN2674_c0_g1_i2.p1 TRINITY_DN2674_c0_g1~~TRINITY_DN2674_c0_g1_i2.p1  ORF type:complete len:233 (-),score=21.34 TRINITY_DN2674_c0_g1_i2:292-990(-)
MEGWLATYTASDSRSPFTKTSAREQLLAEIKRLVDLYKEEEISITFVGHSLGACLSILSAFDLVFNGISKTQRREEPIPVTAFVVGCPEVGNKAFKKLFESLPALRVLHLVNVLDLIPLYPSKLLNYAEIGMRLEIDTRKSTYLKDSKNPSDWHNLQAHLHVLAGWQGKNKPWELRVNRSVALVNKSCDFLKEECLIPASWWIEKNKGLVLDDTGMWVFPDPEDDDVPHPED